MRNVQGNSLHRYNKVRMAFNLLLKLFNLQLKFHYSKGCQHCSYVHVEMPTCLVIVCFKQGEK